MVQEDLLEDLLVDVNLLLLTPKIFAGREDFLSTARVIGLQRSEAEQYQ
jgi:hypothetical protein